MPGLTDWLRERWGILGRHPLLTSLALAGLFTFAIMLGTIRLSRPDALMLIDARTQYLAFTVAQAESASMPTLADVSLYVRDTNTHRCLSGIIEPSQAARVLYRLINDTLLVTITPTQGSKTKVRVGRGVEQLAGQLTLTIGPKSGCLPENTFPEAIRLPVHGEATIGDTAAKPENTNDPTAAFQGMLIDGSVDVFGRPFRQPDELYSAGTFDLSGGTIVSTPPGEKKYGLYGHVLFEPGKRQPGRFSTLSVSGSASTPYLSVARTTLEGANGTEYKIEAALLTTFFKDPLLIAVQVSFALFVTLLNLSLTAFATRRS